MPSRRKEPLQAATNCPSTKMAVLRPAHDANNAHAAPSDWHALCKMRGITAICVSIR